ncbi:MAG: hypothetical protein LH647_19195 [Leptolyngbyaceae cyanobacterium CAN_BIN12]|nr:hypothetical protein [Leptolyngbyaceae cyanobacterium CAN_BIN12]
MQCARSDTYGKTNECNGGFERLSRIYSARQSETPAEPMLESQERLTAAIDRLTDTMTQR